MKLWMREKNHLLSVRELMIRSRKQRKTCRLLIFKNVFNLMCVPIVNIIFYIFQCTPWSPSFLHSIVSPAYKHLRIFTSKWYMRKMNIVRWAPSVHRMCGCALNFISFYYFAFIFSCWTLKHIYKRGRRFSLDFVECSVFNV